MSLYSLLRSPQVAQTCTTLSVPYAFPHLPQILLSALAFFLLQSFSRRVSPRIFPKHFKTFSTKTKLDWDLHFTGWVHSLIATPLSLYLILHPTPSLAADPLFAYAPLEGAVFALSAGYFAYDLCVSLYHVKSHGPAFVLHAVACCFIFTKAYTPFLMGMGSTFLVWEFSTIFLHIHWWLDKLDMSGSTIQLVNGAFLVTSFFGARIAYGGYQTIVLWQLLDDKRVTPALRWGFRAANIALCGLNWSWFRLMIISLRKRAAGGAGTGKAAKGKIANGKSQ